jgi:hypothetical protein
MQGLGECTLSLKMVFESCWPLLLRRVVVQQYENFYSMRKSYPWRLDENPQKRPAVREREYATDAFWLSDKILAKLLLSLHITLKAEGIRY